MKYKSLAVGVIIFILLIVSDDHLRTGCHENYKKDKVISAQSGDINVEQAKTADELEKGLSGRDCIDDNQGMLFMFDRPGYYNFWMKDMKFPIDIVWIDENKRIIEVTDNIQPSSYPDTFTSNQSPMYVLEVQAGNAAKLGLTAGSKLNL